MFVMSDKTGAWVRVLYFLGRTRYQCFSKYIAM